MFTETLIDSECLIAGVPGIASCCIVRTEEINESVPRVCVVGTRPLPAICTPSGGGTGIDTAIGCIPITDSSGKADQNLLVSFLLAWGIGIGGGIALLLIIYASIIIITSAGNPERLRAGKELLTAAIAGLLMLIFSVFLLRIIGVDILRIPGF